MTGGAKTMIEAERARNQTTATFGGGVMLVSNFLGAVLMKRNVCTELGERLAESGWIVTMTSSKQARWRRLVDMVASVWLRRHRYAVAVVDVYSGSAFMWAESACWALRRAGKPYVLALRGGDLPAFARRSARRVRRLLQSADSVVTPSRYLLEEMAPYRRDLHVLPNPLDLGAYHFRLRERPQPRLIWLRAFHNIYNPSLAPVVLARLRERFPDVRLIMVGPDKGDGSLERTRQVARELDVLDRLELPGGVPKSDVPKWLSQGDVFLNTTNVDNTPVSVLEAMASGMCIVSTNAGGLSYLLEQDRDALLVSPNDSAAMSDAVARILTEPGLAARLSRAARAKAQDFDWPCVLPQWISLLGALADGQRP